jgi:hypothetical protein
MAPRGEIGLQRGELRLKLSPGSEDPQIAQPFSKLRGEQRCEHFHNGTKFTPGEPR